MFGDRPHAECDHSRGAVTGTQYGLTTVYTRVWWAPWRKRYWRRCWYCDLKERLDARVP